MNKTRVAAIIFLLGGSLANFWHLEAQMMASRYNPYTNAQLNYNVSMASFVMYEVIIITVAAIAFVFGKRKTQESYERLD